MTHRVIVDVAALGDLAQQLRAVRGALSALDDLAVDAEALGEDGVADATREVQRGWHTNRAAVEGRVDTLAAFVDAAAQAAESADAAMLPAWLDHVEAGTAGELVSEPIASQADRQRLVPDWLLTYDPE